MQREHRLTLKQERCKKTMEAFLGCDTRNLFVCLPRRSGASHMIQKFRSECAQPTTLVTGTRRQALSSTAGAAHTELVWSVDECTPGDHDVWIYESCIATDALAESWRLHRHKAIWFIQDVEQFRDAPTEDKNALLHTLRRIIALCLRQSTDYLESFTGKDGAC